MAFVNVGSTSEVPDGQVKTFDLGGKKVLVAKANGSFYALENKCPHIGKPLDSGLLTGCVLTCSYHKAQFDVRDGLNLTPARVLFLKMACKNARTYPLKVEGSNILIEPD